MLVSKDLGQHRGNQRPLDADNPTPGITQYTPIDPGPPLLEQYAPAIPVRVVSSIPRRSLPRAHTVFLTEPLT